MIGNVGMGLTPIFVAIFSVLHTDNNSSLSSPINFEIRACLQGSKTLSFKAELFWSECKAGHIGFATGTMIMVAVKPFLARCYWTHAGIFLCKAAAHENNIWQLTTLRWYVRFSWDVYKKKTFSTKLYSFLWNRCLTNAKRQPYYLLLILWKRHRLCWWWLTMILVILVVLRIISGEIWMRWRLNDWKPFVPDRELAANGYRD